MSGFGFQIFSDAPRFVSTTEIMPISVDDAEYYRQSNAMNFFSVYRNVEARERAQLLTTRDLGDHISSAALDQLFVDHFGNRATVAKIFKKHQLLVREDFDSDLKYEIALMKLASTIAILPSANDNRRRWTIKFEFNDEEKWLSALVDLTDKANQNVRETLKLRFYNLLNLMGRKRAFELEDMDAQIAITKAAYQSNIARRLAHLEEQAEIARSLDISKPANTNYQTILQTQNLGDIPAEIVSEGPLYIRGYPALDKQIELIKSRQNSEEFAVGLVELNQQKQILLNDKTLERAEALFAETPVMASGDFQAMNVQIKTTKFEYDNKKAFALLMMAIIGSIVGLIYVQIVDAIRPKH